MNSKLQFTLLKARKFPCVYSEWDYFAQVEMRVIHSQIF